MWTKQQKDTLSIIYGDDLLTIGNVVVARDEEKKTCRIITNEGEDLLGQGVAGIGMFLGTGGFHYVVVTSIVEREEGATQNRHSSYGMPFSMQRFGISAPPKKHYNEYKYKIFNSNFEYEFVGSTRGSTREHSMLNRFSIEVGGRLHDVVVKDCIVQDWDQFMRNI